MIKGKTLLLGGSGFLGRGIMRQAQMGNWDSTFVVYSRDEFKQHLCRLKYPDARYILGDIRDLDRLTLSMTGCDTVIHAAALKFIPESEFNVEECTSINVLGTQIVIKAAIAARVKTMIFISTDKAVEPLNTYGLTKALGERLVAEASWMSSGIKFVSCRYGNVIGSTGSVVPVFKQQLETLGHVMVTDPDMTRFWISIDEAVDIIELANTQPSGTILIPEPKAMRIGAIAKAIAGDAVEIIGLRPGEKMHEILLTEQESLKTKFDTLYGSRYNIYFPLLREPLRDRDNGSTIYQLSSDMAESIDPEEFMTLVDEAEAV